MNENRQGGLCPFQTTVNLPKTLIPLKGDLTDEQVLELYHSGRIPYVTAEEADIILTRLRSIMPLRLQRGINFEPLVDAVQKDLIRITDDGLLEWTQGSKTLLAYFCGRMWCGDSSHYSNMSHARVWDRSQTNAFPEKDLATVFGESSLRTLRKNRDMCPLPNGWEMIEEIFGEI